MKTLLENSIKTVIVLVITTFSLQSFAANSSGGDPTQLSYNIVLPDSWQSSVMKQDYGNEMVYNFKGSDGKPVFLFSITKVSDDQWLTIKDNVQHATILKNDGGYITFLEKTDQLKIKGSDNAQYQSVLSQLNNVISTIQINS